MKCNGDCFNCKFTDCIADNEDINELEKENPVVIVSEKEIKREQKKSRMRNYYYSHATEISECRKDYYEKNKEEVKEKNKIRYREYYQKNREKIIAKRKEYYQKHKEEEKEKTRHD